MNRLVLTALCDLYDRLLADPASNIARPGYCDAPVVLALELSREGRLVRAVPLGTQKGKKLIGARLKVPDREKRSGIHPRPNFLCDPVDFILGVDKESGEPDAGASRKHSDSLAYHARILGGSEDAGARAVLAFLSAWNPEAYAVDPIIAPHRDRLAQGGNIVFRLEGADRYIHDRWLPVQLWAAYQAASITDAVTGQCLISGEIAPIAVLHKSISGVAGGQPMGASLVSFNFPAAESYGKQQGANSPVSQAAAFAYSTALNWLTSSDRHRILIGDTTTVFWAERSGPEEDLLLHLFAESLGAESGVSADAEKQSGHRDESEAAKVKGVLSRIMLGRDVRPDMVEFDESVRFYILGLAPNAARLSVRFWYASNFGHLLECIRSHFADMAIVHREHERPISMGRLLLETAPAVSRKRENIPKTVIGPMMRSIIQGHGYPQSLYSTFIARMRVDSGDPDQPRIERKVTYPRVAFIKAHLKRRARITGNRALEEALTEMLNTENKNPGYLLGRLFALLEKAQQDANPEIKATIKDRYYASASATPGAVFPVLIRLAQHHLAKAEYGRRVDGMIEGVVGDLQAFPAHLNLEQQGLFALGYYQQKSDLYRKAG